MRKIITTTFISLDGVMQAPGGPEEDTSNGFKYGGWQINLGDDVTGKIIGDFMASPFELLLGRRTYDIFAGYWPLHPEIELIAKPFNSTKKYVVSHKPLKLSWNNSTLVTGDVVKELKKLKTKEGESEENKSESEDVKFTKELQRDGTQPIKFALSFGKKATATATTTPKRLKLK